MISRPQATTRSYLFSFNSFSASSVANPQKPWLPSSVVGNTVAPTTDDGSHGFCGFATELAEKLLKENKYDLVVACGPEIMMKKLSLITEEHQIPSQFSLERYMKCALGICGQCCVDDVGWRICVEGPVFWADQLKLISEFGEYHRDASGVKHHY
jgi:dihydroorotate dehydrogenase electron transfer subunit